MTYFLLYCYLAKGSCQVEKFKKSPKIPNTDVFVFFVCFFVNVSKKNWKGVCVGWMLKIRVFGLLDFFQLDKTPKITFKWITPNLHVTLG